MKETNILYPEQGRIWLPVQYGEAITRVAYPPVQGTYQECFQALQKDREVKAAQGLELALITFGAYTGKDAEWKDVKQSCFVGNYTRAPYRMHLIPAGHIQGDASLAGVLVENDIQGKGLSTPMQIPDLSIYAQKEGVYFSPDGASVFVPSSGYEYKSFEHDLIAHTHFTPEGTELLAKTAKDSGKTPYDWIAQRMKEITAPEHRVSILDELGGRLGLNGGWVGYRYGRAFGVFVGAEGARQINSANIFQPMLYR